MNRIVKNAHDIDERVAQLPESTVAGLEQALSNLNADEVFAFKDAIALAQLEGRITLEEAETMQHVISATGFRAGTSLGMRAAAYLGSAELLGIDISPLLQRDDAS